MVDVLCPIFSILCSHNFSDAINPLWVKEWKGRLSWSRIQIPLWGARREISREISRTRRYFLLPRESRLVPISDPVVEPLHEVSSLVRFGYYPDWHVAGTCSMTVMNIEYLFGYTTGAYKKLKDDLRFRRLYGWIQFLLVNKTNDQHALIHALEIPCPTNWKCARSVLYMAYYVEFSFSRIVTSTN